MTPAAAAAATPPVAAVALSTHLHHSPEPVNNA